MNQGQFQHQRPDEDNAVVMRRVYPWLCLVDKTTKTIYYYNEENNTYTYDPPSDFFQNEEEHAETSNLGGIPQNNAPPLNPSSLSDVLNQLKIDREKLQSSMESRLEKDRETNIHRARIQEQIQTHADVTGRETRGSNLEENSSSLIMSAGDSIVNKSYENSRHASPIKQSGPETSSFENLALKSCSEMVEATKMNKNTIKNRKSNSIFAKISSTNLSIKYGAPLGLYEQKMAIFRALSEYQSESEMSGTNPPLYENNNSISSSSHHKSSVRQINNENGVLSVSTGYASYSVPGTANSGIVSLSMPGTAGSNVPGTAGKKSKITYLDDEFENENSPYTVAMDDSFGNMKKTGTSSTDSGGVTAWGGGDTFRGAPHPSLSNIPIVPMNLTPTAQTPTSSGSYFSFDNIPSTADQQSSYHKQGAVNQNSYNVYLQDHSEHMDAEYELFFKRLKALISENDRTYVNIPDEIPPVMNAMQTIPGPFEYSDESNTQLKKSSTGQYQLVPIQEAQQQSQIVAKRSNKEKKNNLRPLSSSPSFSTTNNNTKKFNPVLPPTGNTRLGTTSMNYTSNFNIAEGGIGSGIGGVGEQLIELYEANAARKQVDQALSTAVENIFVSMDLHNQSFSQSYSVYKTNTLLEEHINTKYVLDAAIKQRQRLLMPYGLREADAFCHADQLHTFCPQTMTASYFKELLQQQQLQQKRDIQLGKPKRIITKLKIVEFRGWKIYTLHANFAASISASTSIQNMSLPSSRWYVNEEMNIVQRGEPFDLKCYRLREKFRQVSSPWYGVDHLKPFREQNPDFILLRDDLGGYLFYDSSRDVYYCPMGTGTLLTNSFLSEKDDPQYLQQQRMLQQQRQANENKYSSDKKSTATSGGRLFDMINQVIKDVNNVHEEAIINKDGYIIFKHLPEVKPQRLINIEEENTIWSKLMYGSYSLLQQSRYCNTSFNTTISSPSPLLQPLPAQQAQQRVSTAQTQQGPPVSSSTSRLPKIAQEWGFSTESDPSKGKFSFTTSSMNQQFSSQPTTPDTKQLLNIDGPIVVQSSTEVNRQTELLADENIYQQQYNKMYSLFNFEKRMPDIKYLEYCELLKNIKNEPKNPVKYLELALCLIKLSSEYGQYALVAVVLAIDCISKFSLVDHSVYVHSILRLLLVKLSAIYRNKYESKETILSIVAACPENEVVLYQAACCFQLIGCYKLAEKHLIGSLLINPNYDMALRHYAHLLIERKPIGYYTSAKRYLGRIKSTSPFYPQAKIELLWLDEMCQIESYETEDFNMLLSKYNEMLLLLTTNASSSMNATANIIEKVKGSVYKSLGHFFNVKNAPEKSSEFYSKLLKIQQLDIQNTQIGAGQMVGNVSQNVVSLLLSASSTEEKSIVQRESLYNQALLTIHPKSSYVWIGLLSYSDFLLSNINDDQRVEGILWQAVRHSWSRVVWPTIALAHFYQYTRSEPRHGMEILLFACRCRRHYFKNNETYPENIINNLDNIASNNSSIISLSKKNSEILFEGVGNNNSNNGLTDDNNNDTESVTGSKADDNYIKNGIYDYESDFNEFLMKNNQNVTNGLNNNNDDDSMLESANSTVYNTNANEEETPDVAAQVSNSSGGLSEKDKYIEIASILSALGYCLYDLGRFDEALLVTQAALKYIPSFTPAYRCIGLIHHTLATYDETKKLYGTPHEGFLSGIKHGMKYVSPYFLRSYSIHQLLRNESNPSLEFMHLANKLGPNSSLAWRALGFITYFYGGSTVIKGNENDFSRHNESIQYLDCAIQASNKMDVEALKLKGQILMELGKYSEAKIVFHSALQVNPHDQISAVCFAMASYSVNLVLHFEQTSKSQHKVNDLSFASSQDLLLDIHNIESLFQEAISPAALKASLANNLKKQHEDMLNELYENGSAIYGQNSSYVGGTGIRDEGGPMSNESFMKNLDLSTKKRNNNIVNVINDLNNTNGDIHYFYAIYQLKLSSYYHGSKRSSHINLAKLFFQKVAREDNDIQVLGVFMLGWIEELNQNYDDAESFYNKAMQSYTMIEPFRFLQLISLAEEMLESVSRPEDKATIMNRQKHNVSFEASYDESINSINNRRSKTTNTTKTNGQIKSRSNSKNGKGNDFNRNNKSVYDPMTIFDYSTSIEGINGSDSQQYLSTNQQPRRLLLHLKLLDTLNEYKDQMISQEDSYNNLKTPTRYLSIDRQWKTKLMHAFSQCDDWSWLYTCGNVID